MNSFSQKAVTLTELMVATVVVAIIMVGVASIDQALRQSEKGTSRNALLAMRTSAAMLHITKNVQRTDGNPTETGINGIDIDSFANTLCIRMEDPLNGPPTTDPPTWDVSSYGDDIWVSYTLDTTDQNIYYCEDRVIIPPENFLCPAACTAANGEIIGTAIDGGFTFDLQNDSANGLFYLEIELINRFAPSDPADIHNNPELKLTTRINPLT